MLREIGDEERERVGKCQDCGNQAKKGCEFVRCRTCCNNKGFRCQTHVKSTWVNPSAASTRRRSFLQPTQQNPQTHKPINFILPPPSSSSGGSMSSKAVFRCVRVHSEDESVNEYAYQTSVSIGGRVFSGILYDQGPDHTQSSERSLISTYNNSSDHNIHIHHDGGGGGETSKGSLFHHHHHQHEQEQEQNEYHIMNNNINIGIDHEANIMSVTMAPPLFSPCINIAQPASSFSSSSYPLSLEALMIRPPGMPFSQSQPPM